MGSMSFIYGASYLTLVVAGGDDTETGLPRVHHDSPSNDLVQHLGTVASAGVLLPLKQLLEAHSVSVCLGPVVDTGHPWQSGDGLISNISLPNCRSMTGPPSVHPIPLQHGPISTYTLITKEREVKVVVRRDITSCNS